MAEYLPRRARQAEMIRVFDAWFDVMNSSAPFNGKPERCGYGVNKALQDEALQKMEALMDKARKFSPKHPKGVKNPLPFQRGILRSTASLRGLHADLTATVPGFRYIMTSHVNQDCLENTFSQLRGMCGPNTVPDAVEARCRLRILLMAPSPLVAVDGRGRAVRLEPDTDYISTGQRLDTPGNLTNEALEGLDIQVMLTYSHIAFGMCDRVLQKRMSLIHTAHFISTK